MGDAVHMRPAVGPCAIHEWPTEGLAHRLFVAMREAHGKGGINVCRDCLDRAREDARARLRSTGLRVLELDDASRQRAHEVALYAARPENWYRIGFSDWSPGERPQHCAMLGSFGCVFSYSLDQGKLYRHLSISTAGALCGKFPAPTAVWTIATWFGFTGAEISAEGLVEHPADGWAARPLSIPLPCVVVLQEIGPTNEEARG
jgi:hypothetical protein